LQVDVYTTIPNGVIVSKNIPRKRKGIKGLIRNEEEIYGRSPFDETTGKYIKDCNALFEETMKRVAQSEEDLRIFPSLLQDSKKTTIHPNEDEPPCCGQYEGRSLQEVIVDPFPDTVRARERDLQRAMDADCVATLGNEDVKLPFESISPVSIRRGNLLLPKSRKT